MRPLSTGPMAGRGLRPMAAEGWPSASRIAAISCCWSTMISCAIRRSCSLCPWRSSACAMSIAPWWCGIIMAAKS